MTGLTRSKVPQPSSKSHPSAVSIPGNRFGSTHSVT